MEIVICFGYFPLLLTQIVLCNWYLKLGSLFLDPFILNVFSLSNQSKVVGPNLLSNLALCADSMLNVVNVLEPIIHSNSSTYAKVR
jgi:hypothetical protein